MACQIIPLEAALFCSCKQHDAYVMEGGACNVVMTIIPRDVIATTLLTPTAHGWKTHKHTSVQACSVSPFDLT